MKIKRFHIRMDESLYKLIQAQAKKELRSVSSYIQVIILKALKETVKGGSR